MFVDFTLKDMVKPETYQVSADDIEPVMPNFARDIF
jgi:hypothetical protein